MSSTMLSLLTHRRKARNRQPSGKIRAATLVCTQNAWEKLRIHLLQQDRNERAAFAVLGRAESPSGRIEYFLSKLMPVADADCDQQHGYVVEPSPLKVLEAFGNYAQSGGAALMHLHSHPFCEHATFSGIDDANLPAAARDLASYLAVAKSRRTPRFVRFVTGQAENGFTAEVLDAAGKCRETVTHIRLVGTEGTRVVARWKETAGSMAVTLNGAERARLDRNLNWLGEAGQERIAQTHIAICGLGGLGSEMVKLCRGLGFRRYTLIDHDSIELSNLNRLPWSRSDVGRLKVEVARDFILAAVPEAEIRIVTQALGAMETQTALLEADVIVGCLDNDHARLQMQTVAARHLRPLFDLGSGITLKQGTREVADMGGQLSAHLPGGPCLVCQGLDVTQVLDPAHAEVRRSLGYVAGTEETPTSVVTINSIVAALGADALMKWVTGFSKAPRWLRCDLLGHDMIKLDFGGRLECPICGEDGFMGLGTDEEKLLSCSRSGNETGFFARTPLALPTEAAAMEAQISFQDTGKT